MKFPVRIMLGLVLSAISLQATDLTITSQVTTKKPVGTQVHYYSAQAMRMNDEVNKMDNLVDYSKGVIYNINHKQKKVDRMTFEDLAKLAESLDQNMGGAGAMVGAMMGRMMGNPDDVKVEDQGAEKVAGRTCAKYKITVGKLVQEISVDPSLKHPANPATVAKAMKLAELVKGPMAKTFAKLSEEMSKIKGIPLKTHVTGFMGMDTTTEAIEVKQGPIPASVFDLPVGYKVEDLGKNDGGGSRQARAIVPSTSAEGAGNGPFRLE